MRNGINNTLTETSKFLSLILRHKPEAIGITLDEHGWANVSKLVCKLGISMKMLEEKVVTNNKGRYSFNADKTLIRANQGHSIPVDVELEMVVLPDILHHGTGRKYVASIDEQGLIHKSRLYVHLSPDRETAIKVGSRHGEPVVYMVKSREMHSDGYEFF